ncbi:MAG: cyanoexosortase B system-associated protein [Cyanobacteria bacterium P01_G01_bin.54]
MILVTAKRRSRLAIVLILAVSLLLGAIVAWPVAPSWRSPLDVPQLSALREVRKQGLDLPDDRTNQVLPLRIGGHKWVAQDLLPKQGKEPAALLVRPQADPKDKPYVDWSDLNGFFDWQQDAVQTLTVSLPESKSPVIARWFIARDPQDTQVVHFPQRVAVAQWYAFREGGHPTVFQWFWRDQLAQLRGSREPWVAVSVRLPVKPDITLEETAETMTELVQVVQGTISEMLELEE